MFLVDTFIYLLILEFILSSDAAFVSNNSEIYNFLRPNVPTSSVKTTSAHKTRLIKSIESTSDETTLCMICRVVGCIKSDANYDSANSVPILSYNNEWSQDENNNDLEQNHKRGYEYAFDGSGAMAVTPSQIDAESIQTDEQENQKDEEHQHVHATVNIINDKNMNSDDDDDDGDAYAADDEDCLIGCANNNQTFTKCKALYHKKCLSIRGMKSKKDVLDVCLICNRKISQAVLLQCTNQTKKVREKVPVKQIGQLEHTCASCLEYSQKIVLVVVLGFLVFLLYLIIAAKS